jgi:two-component system alkaline phosphatase synthesis response regulator PhoP
MEIKTLLAEDQHPELYSLLLDSCNGFDITTVRRGDHAVRAAKDNAFDVILMDVRLPILDGIAAIRQIRRFNSEVPIIVFTAYDSQAMRDAAIKVGASAYFVKPVNYQTLALKIIELIIARPPRSTDNLAELKQRRLALLRQQQAIYGKDTPPHITIEIQQIEEELR